MKKNNKQYFFALGINPELSVAEIISQFKVENIDFKVDLAIKTALIITCPELNDDFFNKLGGSKKYGEIINILSSLEDLDINGIEEECEDKFRFGFSLYNFSKSELKKAQPLLRRLGLNYKKELKNKGIKSRLVESKDDELSSVIVHKEKMIEQGADIVLIKYKEEIFFGVTLAVQDYDSFSKRDYGKPGKDAISGMLPPKLARMMLNLASTDNTKTILDPFCGSGTVILEALALGFTNIYGSDKSKEAIEDTESNLVWWQQYNVLNDIPEIIRLKVEDLSKHYDEESIDLIVTEPYLGPPLRGRENDVQIKNIKRQLQDLYTITLKEFAKVLKPGGIVVMVWPVFVDRQDNKLFLSLKDKLDDLNLETIDYLDNLEISIERITEHRQSYFYCREGQRVCREIVVLKKKN